MKINNRKRNRKIFIRRLHLSFRSILFLSFLVFIIHSVLFYGGSYIINKPSGKIAGPRVPETYLTPPLLLPTYLSSVLGVQVINPVDIVKYVNIERNKIGSPSLRLNTILMKAAQMRADVILKYQNFSHQDPHENIELTTVLPMLSYRYRYASENIGMGGLSAENFVGGFMNSDRHRENLLNKDLTETGTAVVTGPYQQYYVNIAVQIFAIPGGVDEERGYTYEDTKKYRNSLHEVNARLNPLIWTYNRLLGNSDFSDEKYRKLKKQQEILNKIYKVMAEEKPLGNEEVQLIFEYNSLVT